jgi:hypothetical protein
MPARVARLLDALRSLNNGSGIVRASEAQLVALTGASKRTVERALSEARKHGLRWKRAGNGRNHHNVFDLAGVKVSRPSTPAKMAGVNGSPGFTPANTPSYKEYNNSSENTYEGSGGSELTQVDRKELSEMYLRHSRAWNQESRDRDDSGNFTPVAIGHWEAMYEIDQEIMRRYHARQESNDSD